MIRPKVDLTNVFFLLGFRGGLAEWRDEAFTYFRERDFLRALAWAFNAELRRALRYGVARDYLNREEALTTIRGRLNVGRQMERWQTRLYPIECRFQEYSVDLPLNQVINAAQRRLRGIPGLGSTLERLLRQSAAPFTDVDEIEYSPATLPGIQFTRLNREWEGVWRLAVMILQQQAIRDQTGAVLGTAFTVDMNTLFEKFIEEIVREEAANAGFEFERQAKVVLTTHVSMKPDLILTSGSDRVAVGDAKYIELNPNGWPHANLYQLLAYCVGLGLPRGLLIYANYRQPLAHRVIKAGIDLEVRGINMTLPPALLILEARKAAQHLVQQARSRVESLRSPKPEVV